MIAVLQCGLTACSGAGFSYCCFVSIAFHCASLLCVPDLNHYPACPQQYLPWATYRRANILAEIRHWAADVLCLQEVDAGEVWLDFQRTLDRLGYSGEHIKRSGDKVRPPTSRFGVYIAHEMHLGATIGSIWFFLPSLPPTLPRAE